MPSVLNNETSALLEKHFDTAFAAPDGIKKLRELILTLAMQGKLVPQDPIDRPASELLKAIEAEKKRLTKESTIKKAKPLPEIKPDEIPYDLPNSWVWAKLGTIIVFTNGYAFKSNLFQQSGIGIIKIGDLSNGEVNKSRMDFIDQIYLQELDEKFKAKFGDLLIAMSGATTGKLGFNNLNETFLINQRVGKIEPIVNSKYYLYNFLSTQIHKNLAISSGSAIPNLSTEQINEMLVPLPPLEEQHRIVAEIDRLMSRCDELEKLRTDRNQKRTTVHTAAIDRLLKAQDDRAFSTAWSFITQHFSELYSVKENVTELRKVILQLAVMGKLVPQDPNDEPASELLKAIGLEKQRLVKEGKIKKSKNMPESKAEEVPYELPKGWQWSNIQKLSLKVTDGEHITPQRSESGYYLLSARNVTNQGIKLDNVDYVPQQEYERIRKRCDPKIGDILVSCSGSVGRIAIVDADEYVMVRSVALIKHEHNFINSLFLANALRSPILQSQIIEKSRTTAQSNLFLGKINELLVPIPPLTEQHRIVAKIDRLMEFCDRLEASIEATKIKQTNLLNVVMSRV